MPPPAGKVEELSCCLPGDKILAWYSDDSMYHERVLIWKTGVASWYILTPDQDLYEEDYDDATQGPARFHIKGIHFTFYSRLDRPVYRFDEELSEADLKKHMETALDEMGVDMVASDSWKPNHVRIGKNLVSVSKVLGRRVVPRRIVKGGGVIQQPGSHLDEICSDFDDQVKNEISAIEPAPPGKIWVSMPQVGGEATFAEVLVSKGMGVRTGQTEGLVAVGGIWKHVHLMTTQEFTDLVSQISPTAPPDQLAQDLSASGSNAFKAEARTGEEVASNPDARVLDVDYDTEGERYKEWRQVTLECREYNFRDWPLDGPLTTQHFIKHTAKHGGDAKRWLAEWMRSKQIQEGDRISFEMKVLMESIYLAGTYDQLNLSSLACIEIIARRIQAIVDAYSSGPIPDWHSAKVMTLYRSPEDAISPQLRSWAEAPNPQ